MPLSLVLGVLIVVGVIVGPVVVLLLIDRRTYYQEGDYDWGEG